MFKQYGEIHNICYFAHQNCAFIQYKTRASAELAFDSMVGHLKLGGQKLIVRWSHKNIRNAQGITGLSVMRENNEIKPTIGLPAPSLPLPMELQYNFLNIAPQTVTVMASPYIPVVAPLYVPVVTTRYVPVVTPHYVKVVAPPSIPVVLYMS